MLTSLIVAIVVGGIAGWIASLIMKKSNGLFMNILLGCVGSIVGSFLLNLIPIPTPGIPDIVRTIGVAVIGSIIILAIFNLIKKK
ncbi:MAG: GlsB/YeaQ/YmgE family stress response membrane protein [Lachnospiraceae bacterium]|nr:GlsB/YeaQ/YmgE family stress response membrane protein [Lachnospiraceae bacterium]